MKEKVNLTASEMHSAGATIKHSNPFSNLKSYENDEEVSESFRNNWVAPFYFELNNSSTDWIEKMSNLKHKITDDIILQNLGDFNWRTRSTGAYFATIQNKIQFIDIIGIHLLKSEVCRAGSHYALALSSFNNNQSIGYLKTYLSYYLKQTELDFDQPTVISALKYLDEINGTNYIVEHLPDWKNYSKFRVNRMRDFLKRSNGDLVTDQSERTKRYFEFWEGEISSHQIKQKLVTIQKIQNF